MHFVCDNVKGKCAQKLRDINLKYSQMTGAPMLPPLEEDTSGKIYPLASSCAKCNTESSALPDLLHCEGCKLTRCVLWDVQARISLILKFSNRWSVFSVYFMSRWIPTDSMNFGSAKNARRRTGVDTSLSAKCRRKLNGSGTR